MNDIPAQIDINRADKKQTKEICGILGSAFTNDPVMEWISGHSELYSNIFLYEAESLYKKHGHMYINREKTGAAMWLPAGVSSFPGFHWRIIQLAYLFFKTGGAKKLKRLAELESLFSKHHPKEDHFYLHAIGAALDNQGRGIGSALLKAGLADCDAKGMPAYLESSNIKNNPLYERYGFRVIAEETFSNGGPTVWLMWRDPR